MICHYWYFLNLNYTHEPYVCNACHDISMMAYELENIAILNVKDIDYRYVIWNMSRNDAINMLNNSKLDVRLIVNMNFGTNKTHVEVIKEGAFGGTYFRDIYSGINSKWYSKSWKIFDDLKNIEQNYYCSNCYDHNANKYGVNSGTSLRSRENKG